MDPKIMSWYLLSRPVADDMKGLPRERGHSTPVGNKGPKGPGSYNRKNRENKGYPQKWKMARKGSTTKVF